MLFLSLHNSVIYASVGYTPGGAEVASVNPVIKYLLDFPREVDARVLAVLRALVAAGRLPRVSKTATARVIFYAGLDALEKELNVPRS